MLFRTPDPEIKNDLAGMEFDLIPSGGRSRQLGLFLRRSVQSRIHQCPLPGIQGWDRQADRQTDSQLDYFVIFEGHI